MNRSDLTFFEHLSELKKRFLITAGAIALGMSGGYLYSDQALRYFLKPLRHEVEQLYFFAPAEAFVVKMKVAFLLGVLAASPVILSQIWIFIAPGLHGKERKILMPLIGVTTFFFLGGAVFSFFAVVPLALDFLLGLQSDILQPMISVTQYMNFLFMMLVGFGAAFNLPVFIIALSFLGWVGPEFLSRYRRQAIALVFVASAVLTPPDIASQIFLAVPLMLLFEISILGSRLVCRAKKRRVLKNLGS